MKKRIKKPHEPRYITIRIKYYPPGKELVLTCFFLLVLGIFYWVSPIVQEWKVLSERTNFFAKELPKFYQSAILMGVFVTRVNDKKSLLAIEAKLPKNDHVINHGSRDKRQVALTFDADMTPEMRDDLLTEKTVSSYNEEIVKILRETKTKATIFASGMWIELYPEVTKELLVDPLFEFGNHSYSHPGFDGECWGLTPLPDEGNKDELEKTQKLLKGYTGKDNKFFRFPGGCYSKRDLEDVWKENMYVVHWDSVGSDGFNDSVKNIEHNVLSSAQNGSVIVLHFNGPPNSPLTDDALPTIIGTLRKRGFEFVKVSELLNLYRDYSSSEVESRIEKLTQKFSTSLEQ